MCALLLTAPRSTSQKFHSTCVPYTHTGESQCACECELHIKHTHTAGSVGQRETNAAAAPLKKNTSCRSQRRCCCCCRLSSRRRSCLLCIVSFALRHCRCCMTCGSSAEEDFVFLEKLLPKIALLFTWKLRTLKEGEQLRSLQDSQVVSFV